jgi:hypothetical protein
MFWAQGQDSTMPPLNQRCIQQWRVLNPTWDVRVLDETTMEEVTPAVGEFLRKHENTTRSGSMLSQVSNLLRLSLLERFGGVWADASLLPVSPLDHFIWRAIQPSGFFTYRFKKVTGGKPRRRAAVTWFLASLPGHELVRRWQAEYMEHWEKSQTVEHFSCHESLVRVLEVDDSARRLFEAMPFVDERLPHAALDFQACLDGWQRGKPAPHVLKRPGQRQAILELGRENRHLAMPSDQWWEAYHRIVSRRLERGEHHCEIAHALKSAGPRELRLS